MNLVRTMVPVVEKHLFKAYQLTEFKFSPFPVAHACGHDCHVATVLTTAKVLSSLRDRLPGTALFVFQPAEEGAPVDEQGGARAMMQADALRFMQVLPTP